jgi:hypothetical protein
MNAGIARQLDALCEFFDDELERQETVAYLVQAQGAAARIHDFEEMEARTEALSLLIAEVVAAEKTRIPLLKEIVTFFELPVESQSLSALILVTPEPWRRRMQEFQTRIKAVLAETKATVKTNAGLMRRSLRVIDHGLEGVTGASSARGTAYRPDGNRPRDNRLQPALIDAHG